MRTDVTMNDDEELDSVERGRWRSNVELSCRRLPAAIERLDWPGRCSSRSGFVFLQKEAT
jgi:hypothetical protein